MFSKVGCDNLQFDFCDLIIFFYQVKLIKEGKFCREMRVEGPEDRGEMKRSRGRKSWFRTEI